MAQGEREGKDDDALLREVTALRAQVAELQRAAARLDRTDSLHVETQLRNTLALLAEAQSIAQLGSWRFDPETLELEWSQEFRRIAGLPDNVTPRVEMFLECLVPEDRPRFIEQHMKSLQHPEAGEMDGRILRPDGELRHVRLKGGRFLGTSGRVELRGTMLDITDQVHRREEFVHSQKREAVGRLAGGIAHDFNNLLTIVTGNLEFLADEVGSRPELDDCLRAVDSAANLTRRLLAFGRRAQLSLKLVDPNELVRSTMSLMQRLVGDQIRLETRLPLGLPHVRVDSVEIERALVNLVVNARNVTAQGGLLTIATGSAEQGAWVEFSVTDEGPGISETDLPHIFEPFYTTRHGSGGTGLGLATVFGTAEQHGGSVRVEAGEHGGSKFTIVIPATAESAPASSARGTDATPPAERALELLVVDDEVSVAEVARRILVARGHNVHVAYSPEQAESIWRQHGKTIDLMICDVVMPPMSGPELVHLLAAKGPSPRVLFISGYNEAATHADLAHPFLAKPFTAALLLTAVTSALESPV